MQPSRQRCQCQWHAPLQTGTMQKGRAVGAGGHHRRIDRGVHTNIMCTHAWGIYVQKVTSLRDKPNGSVTVTAPA